MWQGMYLLQQLFFWVPLPFSRRAFKANRFCRKSGGERAGIHLQNAFAALKCPRIEQRID
jgi:hypothetical protein